MIVSWFLKLIALIFVIGGIYSGGNGYISIGLGFYTVAFLSFISSLLYEGLFLLKKRFKNG